MKPIPLTRCVFLIPFNELLTDIGAPTTSLLTRFRLPTSLEEKADNYVPLLPAIRFTVAAQRAEGIADIGWRAAQLLNFEHLSEPLRKSVRYAPTLLAALQQVCALAPIEDTILRIWIEPSNDGVRVCNALIGSSGIFHLENAQWVQNLMIVYIVREFTGPDWAPATMAFEARYMPSVETKSRWPNTRFLSGQRSSWIDIPRSKLSLPNPKRDISPSQPGSDFRAIRPDPIAALKLTLSTYLDERLPGIAEVAEIAGTSVRSLQRELASAGLTYSTLIDQVRFEKAAELLRHTDARIIDIAFATGYADSAHFTRAFRRMSGVTPRGYRAGLQSSDGQTTE